MRGRSSHRTPGFLRRRGPIQVNGLARSDQIGSVKMLRAAVLEQHRGVVDQRHPQLIAFDTRRRFRLLYVGNETGRSLRTAGEFPSQQVEEAARLRGVRIEEALPVKVSRERAALHESLFTHSFSDG